MKIINNIVGWGALLLIWLIASQFVSNGILPTPLATFDKAIELVTKNHLWANMLFSLRINFSGYIIALIVAIPIGFILGLNRRTREMFGVQIDSMRFIPITALGGLFVALFNFTIWTKVNFLAFGIVVYLIPVVVQRIDEINKVHIQMMKTLGATKWQMFKHVQWKSVVSRLSDDIRILVCTSWTYIIVAEMKNMTEGLGTLVFLAEKQSSTAMVYALLIVFVIIGTTQDKLFKFLDKLIFPFKYI